jgi:hypothetical protein
MDDVPRALLARAYATPDAGTIVTADRNGLW